ncbi:hypothetical protein H0H92_007872 [Tricholoma furcatifolium]|nr:hypothetical protein H0H92_007872 [Tricholoma furcatifolium]
MRVNIFAALISLAISPSMTLGLIMQRADSAVFYLEHGGSCADNTNNKETAGSEVTLGNRTRRLEILKPIVFAANRNLALEATENGSTLQPIAKARRWVYADDVRMLCTGVLPSKAKFEPGFCVSADLDTGAINAEPPNLEDSITQKWSLIAD